MAFDAQAFRARMKNGGARPNLFEVKLSFPHEGNAADEDFTFMCRSAQIPGFNLGVAQAPYFGRMVKFSGDRMFEDWPVRVFNDENFKIRNAFEAWQNRLAMIDQQTDAIENTNGDLKDLYVTVQVTQFAKGGKIPLKTYTLYNCWPTNIGPIELAWDMNDQIEEFSVNFTYDYFTTDKIEGTSVSV